jgi:hypothetical protein
MVSMENKAAKKILKAIKFPGGDGLSIRGYSFSDGISGATWKKSGGHSGRKALSRMHEACIAAGFVQVDNATRTNPDGSRSTTDTSLVHHELNVDVHYSTHCAQHPEGASRRGHGSVAYENHFEASVTFPD